MNFHSHPLHEMFKKKVYGIPVSCFQLVKREVDIMKIGIIIPSDCPDEKLVKLGQELVQREETMIVVVDDGCGEDIVYKRIFQMLEDTGISVLHHRHKLGRGVAIKTGMRYAIKHGGQISGIVTVDEDGWYGPEDVFRVCDQLEENRDSIILGTRDLKRKEVPPVYRLKNHIASLRFRLATGIACDDVQSKLRGIPQRYFDMALSTEGKGYRYELTFLTEAAKTKVPLIFLPSCQI